MTYAAPNLDRFKRTTPPPDMRAALLDELRADPALLAELRAEHGRLSGTRANKPLIECCHISKESHAAFTALLADLGPDFA